MGTAAHTDEITETGTNTRAEYAWKVVLFNDEDHTYPYVIEMLAVCCKLSREAAFQRTLEVDLTGRSAVYSGTHEDCTAVCAKILNYGPDHRLPRSMGSMDAEVQN